MYCLRLINTGEIVDRIQSSSLEQAKIFFMQRKQMTEKQFDKLYEVTIDEQR